MANHSMRRFFIRLSQAITAAVMLGFMCLEASAQLASLGPPVGRVSINQVSVAFIGSAAVGGGTLSYEGRKYRFDVAGLGVGGFGASRLNASGNVYGLGQLADFEGPYLQLRSGWAAGEAGSGLLWLHNTHGVVLKLRAQRRGLALTLGADGMVVSHVR
jgi:hypothetical protein